MFYVDRQDTGRMFDICSKSTRSTHQRSPYDTFIVNFISPLTVSFNDSQYDLIHCGTCFPCGKDLFTVKNKDNKATSLDAILEH